MVQVDDNDFTCLTSNCDSFLTGLTRDGQEVIFCPESAADSAVQLNNRNEVYDCTTVHDIRFNSVFSGAFEFATQFPFATVMTGSLHLYDQDDVTSIDMTGLGSMLNLYASRNSGLTDINLGSITEIERVWVIDNTALDTVNFELNVVLETQLTNYLSIPI